MAQEPSLPPRSHLNNRANYPSPLNIDHSRQVEESPLTWNSHASHDGLMSAVSPTITSLSEGPRVPLHGSVGRSLTPAANIAGPMVAKPQRAGGAVEFGVRRTSAHSLHRQSSLDDEDARLVMDSIHASRSFNKEPPRNQADRLKEQNGSWTNNGVSRSSSDHSYHTPISSSGSSSLRGNQSYQPTGGPQQIAGASLFDSDDADFTIGTPKASYPPLPRKVEPAPQNKVMTPAQFEQYRKQKETSRDDDNASKSDDSSDDDNYDEDDDTERNRLAVQQRRQQEAHLAVYRQQMKKVTGETAPLGPTFRPGAGERATQSTSNLPLIMSNVSLGDEQGAEQDDDVPLAILQAHGFPNKNRPPTQLNSRGSFPNLRSTSQMTAYPPPPQSVAGSVAGGGGGGRLPVFARNLPQDPYFGASLVNPANRESLAFGSGASAYGGGTPGLPAGGLIGVIAGEEASRKLRRGSPNATGSYNDPMAMPNMQGQATRSQTMGNMSQMGMMNGMGQMPMPMPMNPMMGVPMTAGDQAQFQMAQQMQQFMAMQVQFMQAMASGNMGQLQQQLPQMPQNNFLAPPGAQRPNTMFAPGSSPQMPGGPGAAQHMRSMSMMDAAGNKWNNMPQGQFRNSYAPRCTRQDWLDTRLQSRLQSVALSDSPDGTVL